MPEMKKDGLNVKNQSKISSVMNIDFLLVCNFIFTTKQIGGKKVISEVQKCNDKHKIQVIDWVQGQEFAFYPMNSKSPNESS